MDQYYSCEVYGDTYPIRESLKKLGFRFNSFSKSWSCDLITEKEKETFEKNRAWQGAKFIKHGKISNDWERKDLQ